MIRVDALTRSALDAGTYDVPDVAALLKCSERHVRNLAADHRIPGIIRCGRLLRFHRGILNDWLTEQAKGGCHAV
jgi:excisionase family DNA binding protein